MGLLPAIMCGNGCSGSAEPLCGGVYNLSVQQGQWDSVDVAYRQDAGNATQFPSAVYLNGALAQVVPAAGSGARETALAGLADGAHTVDVYCAREGDPWPDRHGNLQGQRSFVEWAWSTDTSVTSYKVYQNGVLAATITERAIQKREYVTCDTGAGRGRVTLYGSFHGADAINHTLTLTMGSGTYAYSIADVSGTGQFGSGETVVLPYGVRCTFHDDPTDYEVDDSFTCFVGVKWSWLSDALDAGTYSFAVTACDAAGNESDPITARVVTLDSVPGACSGVSFTWNSATDTVTVAWTDPALIDGVHVYCNHLPLTDELATNVYTERPYTTIAAGVQSWSFTTTDTGTLLFYLRPYKGHIEREDLTLPSFSFPPEPTDLSLVLGEPTSLAAYAAAGGKLRIDWDYRFRNGDDIATFSVYVASSASFDYAVPTVSVSYDAGSGYPVAHYSHTTTATYEGTQYVTVRAVDASGNTSTNTGYVTVTPDATAPTFTGRTYGAPQ